jgi:hypothetical protein
MAACSAVAGWHPDSWWCYFPHMWFRLGFALLHSENKNLVAADIQPWALAPTESEVPLAMSKSTVTVAEDEIEVNASPEH